jgi:hypothetical protein
MPMTPARSTPKASFQTLKALIVEMDEEARRAVPARPLGNSNLPPIHDVSGDRDANRSSQSINCITRLVRCGVQIDLGQCGIIENRRSLFAARGDKP